MGECECARVYVGTQLSDNRNWNPDCPQHGIQSAWWKSPEQVMLRRQKADQLADLQAKARAAKGGGAGGPSY